MRLNFYNGLIFFAILGISAACVAPLPSDLPSPTPVPTLPPTPPSLADKPISAVGVTFEVEESVLAYPEVIAGSTVHFLLHLVPSLVTFYRGQDGSVDSTAWDVWPDQPSLQMKTCFSAAVPCSLSGPWLPFQSQISHDVAVDWLGKRTFYASTQFRTASGEVIQAGEILYNQVYPIYSASLVVTSEMPVTPGAGPMPAAVLTAQAATQVAYPVTGSIVIENGRGAAGGSEGTQIPLQVQFQASSPAGQVTQMRIDGGNCQRNAAALDAPWEPLVLSKTYWVTLMINWSLFQLNVQYRDEKGNLSPVYCAEISLEGMPKP